ncbi:diuretic hormone receptor-like [Oppia nitens]|uniref:diuretic hormone receptor-like n=1 Tax=Oppia nitens TaxID=1686743 RepID=UPI0023DC1A71|nr:diuretic hormone receptor-like [Oppia nitens]
MTTNITNSLITDDDIGNDYILNVIQLTKSSSEDKCYYNNLSSNLTAIDNQTNFSDYIPNNTLHCNTTWDQVSCWTSTMAGQLSVIPCFGEFNGVLYDIFQNSSRMCYENGSWAEKADYSKCMPLPVYQEIPHTLWDVRDTVIIYYTGYIISLIALTIALWIFLYFKDLRCVRNTIHTNLMITYMLIAICWIITDRLHSNPLSNVSNKSACTLVILLTYLMGTNFFWMFVEGLYLYILVVKTFSIELVKVHLYAFIGWGLPALVVIVWAPVKYYFTQSDPNGPAGCPWQLKDYFDYIFICPVLLVLLVNIFFLGKIMWVLITKLRAATSAESKQYRKAAKALLVLTPLLGVAYMLVLVTPTHRTAKVIFHYLQALLVSTQGFTVAVLYCFCNGEVRNSVRHHFERFKLRRTLRGGEYPATGHRSAYAFRSLRNGDNVKLYRTRGERDRTDRGSCISFSTTTTYVTSNSHSTKSHHKGINGSVKDYKASYGMVSRKPSDEDVL